MCQLLSYSYVQTNMLLFQIKYPCLVGHRANGTSTLKFLKQRTFWPGDVLIWKFIATVTSCTHNLICIHTDKLPTSFLTSVRIMHQPVTLAQQLAYNEPNTFVAEHRKISDIKYLHPFTNKVILLILQSITLCWADHTKLLTCLIYDTENGMAGHS
jgi:hypothetical protein